MIDTSPVYKKADKKKKAAVRRVTPTAEAAAAYEKIVRERDERDRDYARHLSQDNKPK